MADQKQDSDLERLAYRFERQRAFTAGYSPLYSRLFGTVAGWLSSSRAATDPQVGWLLEASRGRSSLETTLLLAAGLHRDVLAGESCTGELAGFYPTVGGRKSPDAPGFDRALRTVMAERAGPLMRFMKEVNVQTNEGGRGLCWLLPLMFAGWRRVHLVDLGASAGLNLVADLRNFRLIDTDGWREPVDIGQGAPVQFTSRCRGGRRSLERLRTNRLPEIHSRLGCDREPFPISTGEDELILRSFVWADQVERMERLEEGIATLHQVQGTSSPVQVLPCTLPDGLGSFLERNVPADPPIPVVIYNTYMTPYLADKGQSLAGRIGRWAEDQDRPVLWLAWEPVRDGRTPPVEDWILWSAELWHQGSHRRWELAWVHPHGHELQFEGGLADWSAYQPENSVS